MNQRWTPESHVRITDDGLVIELKLHGVRLTSLRTSFEEGVLCIHGQHDEFGKFVSRFEIPANHNITEGTITLHNDVLRFEVPSTNKKAPGSAPGPIKVPDILRTGQIAAAIFGSVPRSMMIYCKGCGKHFDIVVTAKGAQEYRCPHCAEMQLFDLENLINQAMEQASKMFRKKRGRR